MTVLTDSPWRHNFAEPTEVAATVHGVRQPYRAKLEAATAAVAALYEALIARLGLTGAGRRLGLRLHVDRPPTRDELTDVVRRSGLAAVRLEPVRRLPPPDGSGA